MNKMIMNGEKLTEPTRTHAEVVAGEILATLQELGVTVKVTDGDKIRYKPRSAVDEELNSRIREHKPALVVLLKQTDVEEKLQTINSNKQLSQPSQLSQNSINTDTYSELGWDSSWYSSGDTVPPTVPNRTSEVPGFLRAKGGRAAERGLVARYSREFGFISVHDPTTGEWHDIASKDAPDWAKNESRKRKELWKAGDRGAFNLSARKVEAIFEGERPEMWEHPYQDDRGVVYEDYADEDGLDWQRPGSGNR
jgi:TubC N-terminal docking domain